MELTMELDSIKAYCRLQNRRLNDCMKRMNELPVALSARRSFPLFLVLSSSILSSPHAPHSRHCFIAGIDNIPSSYALSNISNLQTKIN